jgi:hypothetical protein
MQTYSSRGERALTSYEAAIKANKPDAITVTSKEGLKSHGKNEAFLDMQKLTGSYIVDVKPDTWFRGDSAHKTLLNFKSSDIGFEINKSLNFKKIIVRNFGSHEAINTASFDPDGRFVVWEAAFKQANDVADAIPLNELGMQSFIKAVGAKTKNLKVAFLANIQNKEFWAITRQNYNDKKAGFDRVLTFERGTEQFKRYMGSPNLGSKFYAFANHHRAISNRVPSKIVIMPKQVKVEGVIVEEGEPPERVGQLCAALIFQ